VQAGQERADITMLQQRVDSLTPREREVLEFVVSGLLNKQVGHRLGVTEKTIKVHRAQAMHKMQAGSLAALVHMAEKVGIRPPPSPFP
jgi:FixJ family two-component response regulator